MKSNSPGYRMLLAIIAILLVANIVLLAFFLWWKPAQHKDRGKKSRSMMTYVLEEKVGFNDQQIEQYHQLKEQHKERMKPLYDSMRSAREELYSHLRKDSDDSTITLISEKIGKQQAAIDVFLYNHFRNVRALCTQQQLAAYDSSVNRIISRMVPNKKK